jgi:regulator of protease activity HflC (stomatin/prohibitin superfamily)
MGALLFLFVAGLLVLTVARTLFARNPEGEWELGFHPVLAVPFGVAFVVVWSLWMGYTVIDAGSVGIVKRFGDPTRTLNPGLHFVLPFADTVTPVAVQTRIVKTSENASSSDLQVVFAEVTLGYHVDPQHATDILVKLNDDAEARVIVPAILESIKAETARYEVQSLIKNRAQVRDGIEDRVKQRLAPYHIVAETVSITNFAFSQQYEASIEAKQVAEQNAEKAKNDLERIKVQAQQQIAQAEGEAAALRAQREQVTPELLQLRTIEMMKEKWNGVLPETIVGGNGALPMMDVLAAAKQRHNQ